jgi:hypothetical protein
MIIELRNCNLKLKWIGTQQDWEIHEYCYTSKRGRSDNPLVHKGRKKSKSPNGDILNRYDHVTQRWCLVCQKATTFVHNNNAKHSRCLECGKTAGYKRPLTVKINKIIHPMRYRT